MRIMNKLAIAAALAFAAFTAPASADDVYIGFGGKAEITIIQGCCNARAAATPRAVAPPTRETHKAVRPARDTHKAVAPPQRATPVSAGAGTVYCRTGSTIETYTWSWFNKNPAGKCTAQVRASDVAKLINIALKNPDARMFMIGITIDTAMCPSGFAIMPVRRSGNNFKGYPWDKTCKPSMQAPRKV